MPARPSKLKDRIKAVRSKQKAKREPFWDGPAIGISNSRLGGFFTCPERFRINNILGVQEPDSFNIRIEYGQIWHAMEEACAKAGFVFSREIYHKVCLEYCQKLAKKYPMDRNLISFWSKICLTQFQIYIEFYGLGKSKDKRVCLYQEEKFKQRITLPSGRFVVLSGIWDLVFKEGRKVWLQDHKTKGQINIEHLKKQLKFDTQTMMYLVALQERHPEYNLAGFKYNVVRRPLSGGKNTIKQKKTETEAEFLSRLAGLIKQESSFYFERFDVEVTPDELDRYKYECLYPVMENLIDDYEWWVWSHQNGVSPFSYMMRARQFPYHIRRHYRTPYGIYNTLADGGSTPLDYYLDNGSMVGLTIKTREERNANGSEKQ